MEFGQNNEENFGQRATYLSQNVKKLVCYQLETAANEHLFLKDGISDWFMTNDNLCKLPECCFSPNTCDYKQAVSCLYPLASAIHHHLLNFTTEEFWEKYKLQLEWTSKSDVFLHCFELLKSPDNGFLEASLLLVTSTLERILGDIFMACSGAAQCPSLLTDLLQTAELKEVLGEAFMFCLEVYIGSPSGLNFRNLAWHGFLSQGELQARHVSFLLICALSLGEEIKKNLKNEKIATKVDPRQLITYPKTSLLQDIFPEIQTNNLAALFRGSNFVTSTMVGMWDLAIRFYKRERYYETVIVILPQLEHSLRRIYASCNNLPERLSTAESSEFYTTFNEILSPVLSDNTPNNLVHVIGTSFMEILLDILVHKEGPRLRDHISHGEVDMKDFPKHLAEHVLNIAIALCQKFSSSEESKCYHEDLLGAVQCYVSIYHPISCFRRECISYVSDLLQWRTLPKPSDENFLHSVDENLCSVAKTIIQTIFLTSGYPSVHQLSDGYDFSFNESVFKTVQEILAKNNLPTSFRPRCELEVVSLLRNIVSQCSQASKQIQHLAHLRYEEWKAKKLRSRQRQNYKRFWYHFPFIDRTMLMITVILVTELTNIVNTVDHDMSNKIKFLKRCLQYGENLSSLSSYSRNRWQECTEIGTLFMEHAQKYYARKSPL